MGNTNLDLAPYLEQVPTWPRVGRHIFAQHDARSVVVYQAFRPEIVHFAAAHGCFGDGFSLARMSWVKPNFLWMMYRCGWATKEGQEAVVAVWLRREAFEEVLRLAVPSSFHPARFATREDWEGAVKSSAVRLQWDPDRHPSGSPLERRAIQLGLRGQALRRYSQEWILRIEDITPFVAEQRARVTGRGWDKLVLPRETLYRPADGAVAKALGLDESAA